MGTWLRLFKSLVWHKCPSYCFSPAPSDALRHRFRFQRIVPVTRGNSPQEEYIYTGNPSEEGHLVVFCDNGCTRK